MSGGGARKWRFGDWAFEDASAAPVSFFMPIKFNRSTNTAGQMYKKTAMYRKILRGKRKPEIDFSSYSVFFHESRVVFFLFLLPRN